MLTPSQIETAVSRSIITASQQRALLLLARENDEPAAADEAPDEQLRLIGGGNDIFVTIGILLFMAGGSFALTPLFGGNQNLIVAIAAAVIWAIAEIVTRQKRMRLSSTLLAVLFMACSAYFVWLGASTQIDLSALEANPFAVFSLRGAAGWVSLAGTGAFVAIAAAYFWRFSVPVLAAFVALALTGFAFLQAGLFLYDGVIDGSVQVPSSEQIPSVVRNALYMPLLCGLIVFAIAVALDLHDRERRTVWSDCAFWLHVVSAPMLVHPLFVMATGQNVGGADIAAGSDAVIGLIVLIAVFTYVALAIDRRSLLVPTLGYFGTLGVQNLLADTATNAGIPPVALVLISVGALVIMFGAGWQRIRHVVIGTTLPAALLKRLPPINA
ncbi:MAG: hypothetical protein WCC66_08075 [Rhizobiaceae bacterium]